MRREYPELPVVACGAVIVDESRVLLVRRAQEPAMGLWAIPGGVVHLGEKVEEAAKREILEETGLEIEIEKLVGILDNIIYDDNGCIRFHYVLIDYLAHPISGDAKADSDASQVMWVSPDEMENIALLESSKIMIEKALRK